MNPSTSDRLDADHFTLLGVARAQRLDRAALDAHYRELQSRVHPDKHAHASPAEQRQAMQWATRVNEAYQTLKAPLARARYLLALRGHDVAVESNTSMPAEFLMAQMELREEVEGAQVDAGATAVAALEAIAGKVRRQMRDEYAQMEGLIDEAHDDAGAALLVRQLMFQEKLLHEIDTALDALVS